MLLVYYPVVSVVTFFTYLKDKRSAQQDRWRTPESSLHFLALIGGWPGAALAQSFLRHKSRKQSFRTIYWLTVIIHCAVVGWILYPTETDKWPMILGWLN